MLIGRSTTASRDHNAGRPLWHNMRPIAVGRDDPRIALLPSNPSPMAVDTLRHGWSALSNTKWSLLYVMAIAMDRHPAWHYQHEDGSGYWNQAVGVGPFRLYYTSAAAPLFSILVLFSSPLDFEFRYVVKQEGDSTSPWCQGIPTRSASTLST